MIRSIARWVVLAVMAGVLAACVVFPFGPPPPRTYTVALGDLDGDGDLDAVAGNGPGNTDYAGEPNTVWLNDGRGRFGEAARLIPPGTSWDVTHSVALGDLDSDGDLDIVFGNAIPSPNTVWLNDGAGRFSLAGQAHMKPENEIGYSMSKAVALGDLDGDGDLDVYVGNCCRGQWAMSSNNRIDAQGFSDAQNMVWWNDGRGQFADSGQRLGNWATGAVALGDLDGDGDLDAFEVNQGGRPEFDASVACDMVWLNDGQGRFSDSGQCLGDSEGYAVALGDLDGDGDLDALVGNAYRGRADQVWLNDGDAGFADSGQQLGDENTRVVALDDLDGDGDLDAFVGADSGGQIWINDGGGRFEAGQRCAWTSAYAAALADVDGDGDRDVFAIRFSGRTLIWRNNGAARFTK